MHCRVKSRWLGVAHTRVLGFLYMCSRPEGVLNLHRIRLWGTFKKAATTKQGGSALSHRSMKWNLQSMISIGHLALEGWGALLLTLTITCYLPCKTTPKYCFQDPSEMKVNSTKIRGSRSPSSSSLLHYAQPRFSV